MLIHPFKDISWGGGESTLTLKIGFKLMVEKNPNSTEKTKQESHL